MTATRPDLDAVLAAIALTRAEYDLILERLGREPTDVELGMFSAMWSEHCGYKNSRLLLRLFPTEGPRVVVRVGEENAGAVDIGDGQAIVFKMESHNHPSAIEPYQGAATGVGGIVRDIFTMGARPIALLNSLRFGPLDQPRNRFLFDGVVAGIAGYGNCLGIPNVGGEVVFEPCYGENPLVNAMCVGLLQPGELVRARAEGVGNLIMIVGAATGRDGIHGATFASVELSEASQERRPAVQVGNPFMEKLLMEACLELAREGLIVGMQDLGAAGLTSSTVECADKGAGGAEIDVALAPRRETGMTAYEMMLSESQERMLVIVTPEKEAAVRAVFDRWDLECATIGRVTDDGLVRVLDQGRPVAEIPTRLLTDPPLYRREGAPPAYLAATRAVDFGTLPQPGRWGQVLLDLIGSPNLASRRPVYRRYDHQVMNNTVVLPGGDAAVLRIKGTPKAIAVTADGDGRLVYLDPFQGGAIAVAEAARNLSCTGAEPLALTDCLNFGNPEKPEIYYQLEQAILGMAEACRVLGTPVISGNVSLYNESSGSAVYPTPTVGMVGLIEDVRMIARAGFQSRGDLVALLGTLDHGPETLAGSEYASLVHGIVGGTPFIDLEAERRLQVLLRQLIREELLRSAHDCSRGGLAITVAESCLLGGIGAEIAIASQSRPDVLLFGEAQSRVVVSLDRAALRQVEERAAEQGVPFTVIGEVAGPRLTIGGLLDVSLEQLRDRWERGLLPS